MRTIEDTRVYSDPDTNGRKWKDLKVKYTIYFDNRGRIEDIRNEFGHMIEHKSECFDYFRSKYE